MQCLQCDKFKEAHRNLQQVLSPLVTTNMEALIGGCKMLIRIKEVKQKQDCKFNCAAVVSNCRNINPHFTSQIISLGRTFNKEQLKKIPQPAAIKGFVIQFFGCIENVISSQFELDCLVTIEIVNCPIKRPRVLVFMGPICTTEKMCSCNLYHSPTFPPQYACM